MCILVPGRGTHITKDMCFLCRGIHITRDMFFLGGGTPITRDMGFPCRGTHHLACISRVGQHISLGIYMSFLGREHISQGVCVSLVGEHIIILHVGICVS